MILTLHRLAETYNVLPSEALGRGNTFDLFVLDLHHKWLRHQEAQSQGKATPGAGRGLTEADMMAMIERAKNFKPKERK
jgi:hypothetical protein